MDRTLRYVRTMFGNIRYMVDRYDNRKDRNKKIEDFLKDAGFSVVVPKAYGCPLRVNVGSLWFDIYFYTSNHSWNLSYGFRAGGPDAYFHRLDKIDEERDAIASLGIVVPEGFPAERSDAANEMIALIKSRIREAERSVRGYSYCWHGSLGSWLRAKGYRVTSDGGSVCKFVKDGISYSAHAGDGWRLEDFFQVYFPDNILSWKFSLGNNRYYPTLEKGFEALFGEHLTSLGRYRTELEMLKAGDLDYRRFLVRKYANRYLTTLGSFDTFEEARTFARDEAKRLAAATEPCFMRYAHKNPVDCGDDYDYLAMFVYYECDESSKHFLFVQGATS